MDGLSRHLYVASVNETLARVAVVDDEEAVRRGLERLLKSFGFAVEGFASGESLLESLSGARPDCILLDLHMPGLDGFAVLARLSVEAAAIPVVVITGYDTIESRERAMRLGVSGFLRKPLDARVLLEALGDSMGGGGKGRS